MAGGVNEPRAESLEMLLVARGLRREGPPFACEFADVAASGRLEV